MNANWKSLRILSVIIGLSLGMGRISQAQTLSTGTLPSPFGPLAEASDSLGNIYAAYAVESGTVTLIELTKVSRQRQVYWERSFAIGKLPVPASVAVDASSNVYVAVNDLSLSMSSVLKFNPVGVFISSTTAPLPGPSYSPLIAGIAVDSAHSSVYIAETFVDPNHGGLSSALAAVYDLDLNYLNMQTVNDGAGIADEANGINFTPTGEVNLGVTQQGASLPNSSYQMITYAPRLSVFISRAATTGVVDAICVCTYVNYISGDGQSASAGSALQKALTVELTDFMGNPVSLLGAYFTITSAPPGATGQTFTPAPGYPIQFSDGLFVLSDSLGMASIMFTVGNEPGDYQITSNAFLGVNTFTFNETATTATVAVPSIEIDTGDAQIGFVNQTLPEPLTVITTTTAGPAQGTPVDFTLSTADVGSASLSVSSIATNANGLAATELTLSSVPVDAYVNASCPSCQSPSTVTFHECAKLNVPYFNQGDGAPWAGDAYDDTADTMGGKGCGVSALAMLAEFYGVTTGVDGKPVNPGNLNAWLENNNGYYSGGSVQWDTVYDYTAGKVQFAHLFNSPQSPINPGPYTTNQLQTLIQANLLQGVPVIVFVKNPTTGHPHFILLTSVCGLPGVVYTVNDSGNFGFSTWDMKGYVLYGIRTFTNQ